MGPWDINNEKVLFIVNEWIHQCGALYVDVYRSHSGEQGRQYLIRDIIQFDKLIQEEDQSAVFSVFKDIFVLQGFFDEKMRSAFKVLFNEGEHWFVLTDIYYPKPVRVAAIGTSWFEFEKELIDESQQHKKVFVGRQPDIPDYWLQNTDENVMILCKSSKYCLGSQSWFDMKVRLININGINPVDHALVGTILSPSTFNCNIKLLEPTTVNGQRLDILEITSRQEDYPLVRIGQKSFADLLGITSIVPVKVKDFHSELRFTADLLIDE